MKTLQKYTVVGFHPDNEEPTVDHVRAASVPDAIDSVREAAREVNPDSVWQSVTVLVGFCHLAPINWCLYCGSIGVDRDVSRCDVADHKR